MELIPTIGLKLVEYLVHVLQCVQADISTGSQKLKYSLSLLYRFGISCVGARQKNSYLEPMIGDYIKAQRIGKAEPSPL